MQKFFYFTLLFLLIVKGASALNLTGVKICINPGHGGFDADDRNVVIAPFTSGDPNGFWESTSNLDKGLFLRDMLTAAGATVIMTRTTNTTADDLPLSQIVAMANQANVDFMLSIHSNAGNGVANFVLMLHVGVDPTDTQVYNTFNPNNPVHKALSDRSRDISTEIARNIFGNQITTWSSGISIRGDKTFARTAMGWSDGYGVLRGLFVPGVISEGAMHDYIPETYRLMNIDYKWLEAWYFLRSFANYFNGGQIPTGVIAGSVLDSRIKRSTTFHTFKGRDEMLPLNGTKLTLLETGQVYTVDNMQNGVYLFRNVPPGVYHVRAEKEGYYSQTQQVTVSAHHVSFSNFSLNRVRSTPPRVIAWTPNVLPTDSVDASVSILIEFNWDMDETTTAAAFRIEPSVPGKITFEDSQFKMRFTPDRPLDKATVYTVTIDGSATHPDNLSLGNDFRFSFLTRNRNRLALLSSYPNTTHHRVHFASPQFRFIFDRRLNTWNLQTAIRVLEENGTVVAKNARSVVNNQVSVPFGSNTFRLTNNLVSGRNYILEVDSEVSDEVGMKVVETIRIPFTAIDALRQEHPVLRNFETPSVVWEPAHSRGVQQSAVSSSSTRLAGNASNQISVQFNAPTASAFYRLSESMMLTTNQILGVHIHGDLSGNTLALAFRQGNDTTYVQVTPIDFAGWEYHEANLSGIVNTQNVEWIGFRIQRTRHWPWSASSEILLDQLVAYAAPLSVPQIPISKSLFVYPNPTKDWIYIRGNVTENTSLTLYSFSGVPVLSGKGHQMYLGNIAAGVYFLKAAGGETVMVVKTP